MKIPAPVFKAGLEVELEHGTRYPEANVTNNHPLVTGRIVVAHLKESMDYYRRLAVAEAEGDLLAAILAGDGRRCPNNEIHRTRWGARMHPSGPVISDVGQQERETRNHGPKHNHQERDESRC